MSGQTGQKGKKCVTKFQFEKVVTFCICTLYLACSIHIGLYLFQFLNFQICNKKKKNAKRVQNMSGSLEIVKVYSDLL